MTGTNLLKANTHGPKIAHVPKKAAVAIRYVSGLWGIFSTTPMAAKKPKNNPQMT